jgi:lysophospholipase L1-like esterase
LQNLNKWIDIGQVDLCLVNLGIHDAIRSNNINPNMYAKNLEIILGKTLAWCPKTIWVTTTKYYSGAETHTNLNLNQYHHYLTAGKEIATKLKLPICDLTSVCDNMDRASDVQQDGCHFLEPGYRKLAAAIVAYIKPFLKTRRLF